MRADRQSDVVGYHPSGRVDLIRFVPLVLMTIVAAMVMAYVLCVLEGSWYLFVITPFLVGLPVLGGIWMTIRLGRCRNRIVGATLGLLLMSLYYLGYWWMSYQVRVVQYGPEAVDRVAEIGGAPGVLGYINFRCKNAVIESEHDFSRKREHNESDTVFAYVFYGRSE